MKVVIINYGLGNLGSVRRAFETLGVTPQVTDRPEDLSQADRIILPGVGAFDEAMMRLREGGWVQALDTQVRTRRVPLMGICLGMQLLATTGEEGAVTSGLGYVPGTVRRLDHLGCKLRIPHVGWNEVSYREGDPLFAGIPNKADFYFVHSFAFSTETPEHRSATTNYGVDVTAVVRNGNVYGCQFHPEKSSKAGDRLLKNFLGASIC